MNIIQNYITNEGNRCYEIRNNTLGVTIHSTSVPGVGAQRQRTSFQNNCYSASAHAFVDWSEVVETIPFNEVAWHAGGTANSNYVGIEMCEPFTGDSDSFSKLYVNAVNYVAHVMRDVLGITTVNDTTLISHCDATERWHETDHIDPIPLFNMYGKSMHTFRQDVQNAINGGSADMAIPDPDPSIGYVTADVLNVRSGPGTEYEIIGTLTQGETVRLFRDKGEWYDIYFGDHGGFVSKEFIKTSCPNISVSKPEPQQKSSGRVTADVLNVRSGPGTKYEVIGQVYEGQIVRINKERDGWFDIFFGNHGGYVSKEYIK